MKKTQKTYALKCC